MRPPVNGALPPLPPPEADVSAAGTELLRLAIEAAEVGLWDLDVLSDRLYWPPRVKAMFGLAADVEVSMAHFRGGVHPDDRVRVLAHFEAATDPQRRAVYDVEYRTVGPLDGAVRWVAAKGRGLFDPAGHCVRVIGTAMDITARRTAEAKQRQNEERLEVLDRIGEATRELTDAEEVMRHTARLLGEHLHATRCAYADVEADSDAFTIRNDWAMPGVPSSAGTYSLDLFGPQATTNLRSGRHLVVNDVDAELGDDGGARMFNAIGIKAIVCAGLVKSGRLVAMMAVHQATPRRWTPQEVHLIGEVVDRCWAHIERVRDAAMLREQDRRKDEFLATLAHELRNPIAPLMYAAQLLKRVDDATRQLQARDVVERQSRHLARLIDDLLDVSRINRGLVELQCEVQPLAPMLRDAFEAASPALARAHHRTTLVLPDDDVLVDADATRIVQVVTNLLNNAAKYTPDGGDVQLTARADASAVFIDVSDNGIGIAPQDRVRLFHLFTQLPTARGQTQGGLGIGLALVQRLVEMHGGSVAVRSEGLGSGSTFSVTLPRASSQRLPLRADHSPRPATPSAQAGRVLVVEDNVDGLETLLQLLADQGIDARGAADGAQALEVATEWQPTVILLDLGLPGLDGHEVAAGLRRMAALDRTWIVALTGWGAAADRTRTAASGFDAHLTKPVAPDALVAAVSIWLAQGRLDKPDPAKVHSEKAR